MIIEQKQPNTETESMECLIQIFQAEMSGLSSLDKTTKTYTQHVRIFEDKQRSIKSKAPLLNRLIKF